MENKLFLWTIYEKGTDRRFPSNYVAAQFEIHGDLPGPAVTEKIMIAPNVELLRDFLTKRGHVKMQRSEIDDDSIIESWI